MMGSWLVYAKRCTVHAYDKYRSLNGAFEEYQEKYEILCGETAEQAETNSI